MEQPSIHPEVLQKPDWGSDEEMRVTKRDGSLETVSFDKILQRFRRVGKEATLSTSINYTAIAMKVIDQLYDKISSSKIDELCAEQCASLASTHPDYTTLAGRIVVSSHHKNTDAEFSKVMQTLYEFQNFRGDNSPMISAELYKWSQLFARELEEMIDYSRDYLVDYFGFKTLERAYLMRLGGKHIVERPQHMWMRVAVAIHGSKCINQKVDHATISDPSREWKFDTQSEIQEYADALRRQIPDFDEVLRRIRETYDGMSLKQFIHATPTLFNAGTPRPQLSSCFLVAMESDSIDGIYNTLKECATISKWAGGIGLHIHNIRASGSYIEGTGGSSNGIVPMLRVFNHTAKYVDQCVHPETQIIVKNPDSNAFEWRAIQDLQIGDQINNLPVDDPAGFSQAQFLQTNDTTGPNGPVMDSIQPVHPGTNDPVSLLQLNGDSYRNNVDVVKQVVKSTYAGEMIYIRTAIPSYFLRLTPEHPVLVVRNKSRLDPLDLNGSSVRRGRLEWVSARDLKVGSSLLIHSNTFLDVDNVTTEWYEGDVYDLEMTTYPNYMTSYGLVHNGGGKRNGSFAIYLEPWHADVELFLQMRKNHGDEELKARDLFYALWIPDLFMERMQQGGDWTLMCPNECPGLAETYGDEFKTLYESYERSGRGRKTMKARDLWLQILDAQMETGTPYLCYKDSANQKSNQKNVGTIKSSNLCSEIVEYSDDKETAVCNLASIALPAFFRGQVGSSGTYDFDGLYRVAKTVTYNLNQVIDINYYPTEKTRVSNMRHRPIGIGVQGLADVFILMGYSFSSDEARELNRRIFETIYYAAVEQSMELAKIHGPYASFHGSPSSFGQLQFDMWNVDPTNGRHDWTALKAKVVKHGLRNSLLLAPMPTASTSQILGYNECVEPITSNIFSRRTLAGEFILCNKYLMRDLMALGLWNEKIKNNIIANNGSIQQLDVIPIEIREKYKTVWELSMKTLIDMAADRGAFIDQSQSLNLWVEDPNYSRLTSMHVYAWTKGLKTGIYYLRRRGKHQAQKFTIEPEKTNLDKNQEDDHEICEFCSS
jgi:ribonucleoside-diphosphate reductase alpha subunit